MYFYLQKRGFNWPQDLDGETRVVELYVVNDNAQVNQRLGAFLYAAWTLRPVDFTLSRLRIESLILTRNRLAN